MPTGVTLLHMRRSQCGDWSLSGLCQGPKTLELSYSEPADGDRAATRQKA